MQADVALNLFADAGAGNAVEIACDHDRAVQALDDADIEAALARLVGTIQQRPSSVSATTRLMRSTLSRRALRMPSHRARPRDTDSCADLLMP